MNKPDKKASPNASEAEASEAPIKQETRASTSAREVDVFLLEKIFA